MGGGGLHISGWGALSMGEQNGRGGKTSQICERGTYIPRPDLRGGAKLTAVKWHWLGG